VLQPKAGGQIVPCVEPTAVAPMDTEDECSEDSDADEAAQVLSHATPPVDEPGWWCAIL
jgi:hypothetical protein